MEEWEQYHYRKKDFLKTIVREVPLNSLLCFYELYTIEQDYYSDLKEYIVTTNIEKINNTIYGPPENVVKLSEKAKLVLITLIEESSLLRNLIHFSIYYEGEFIIESSDNLKNTAISKKKLLDKNKWDTFYKADLIIEME